MGVYGNMGAKKQPIADLPPNVGVTAARNGAGVRYWRVRLGKRFTGGSVATKSFKSLGAAKEWLFGDAQKLKARPGSVVDLKATAGAAAFVLTPTQLADAANAFRLLRDTEYTLTKAAELVLGVAAPPAGVIGMEEAINLCSHAKREARKDYLTNIKPKWRRFAKWLPAKKRNAINMISSHDVRQFLSSCKLAIEGEKNLRRDLSALFGWAEDNHYIKSNPCTGIVIEAPSGDEEEIRIPTIDETTKLLMKGLEKLEMTQKIGKDRSAKITLAPGEIIPWLVLGLFGGLRPTEASKVLWEYVDFEHKHLDLPGKVTKGRIRRIVPMEPILEDWLREYAPASGTGPVLRNYKRKQRVFTNAFGMDRIDPWPQDWLRHGYGSYHLAKFRNSGDTSENMGHRDTDQLFTRYREVVKKQTDIDAYWELKPEVIKQKFEEQQNGSKSKNS